MEKELEGKTQKLPKSDNQTEPDVDAAPKSEIETAMEQLQHLFTDDVDEQARDKSAKAEAATEAGQELPRRPQPASPPGPIREPWWKLVLSAGGWILGILMMLIAAYDQFKPKPPPREPKVDVKQRFENGPYVVHSKQLSPTEELSLVIVPSAIDNYFDTKCLIYKNREFNQIVFTCPESTQQLWIEEPSDR